MTTTTGLTLEQFLAREETEPASEYACGEVWQKPMPTQKHSFLQTFLAVALFQFLNKTKIGRVGTEWRCIFGPSGRERVFVPDIMYVAREHLTAEPYHRAAPDLVVEIVSPDQDAVRFAAKLTFYLLYGVRLVWVVDPERRTVTVFAPGRESRTLTAGDILDGEDVLPGFRLSLDDLFSQIDLPE